MSRTRRSGCSGPLVGFSWKPGNVSASDRKLFAFSDGLSMICCSVSEDLHLGPRQVDRRRLPLDRDGVGDPRIELEVDDARLVEADRDAFTGNGAEAGHRCGHGVTADLDERRAVDAGFVRDDRALRAGVHVRRITVTPGSTPPLVSVTVPWIVPVTV